MAVYRLGEHTPVIHPSAFVAESASVIGRVTLEEGVSIWPGVVIRADNDDIVIRANSNIQENSVLHVDGGCPIEVGPNVTVGHQAMLHGCTVREGALVGIGAIVLNGAVVGRNALIGAGAIVPEGREIPEGVLVIGVGKVVRALEPDEIDNVHRGIASYVVRGQQYKKELQRVDG
jgi:carbonic anhydrase/acetyltransferase-like protein (isoleucine patch superfamily)